MVATELESIPRDVITGASRGVGKYLALGMAEVDVNGVKPQVILTYNSKESRALGVREEILARVAPDAESEQEKERYVRVVQVDLSKPEDVKRLIGVSTAPGGYVRSLFPNAAVGLEFRQTEYWAKSVNVDANFVLVNGLVPHMRPGSKIGYSPSIYSHALRPAEWNGQRRVKQPQLYRLVAETKHQFEAGLRNIAPDLDQMGIAVYFGVGQLLEGTGAHSVIGRANKAEFERMTANAEGGKVPHARDEAEALVNMVRRDAPTGTTEYIGGDNAQPMLGRDYEAYELNDYDLAEILDLYGPHTRKIDRFESPEDSKLTGIGYYRVREEDTIEHFLKQRRRRTGQEVDIHVFPGHWALEASLLALGINFYTIEPEMQWVPFLTHVDSLDWLKPVKNDRDFRMETEITAMTPAMVIGRCDGYVGETKVYEGRGLTLALATEDKAADIFAKAP